MRRFNYKGFYGDYGCIVEHNDATATLEMICSGKKYRKTYKSLTGAKIALGRMSDSYTLTEVKHG